MINFWNAPIFWLMVVLLIWTIPWKGYALWTAAKRNEKGWFVVLLLVNTLAILEIYYIFIVAKKDIKDIKAVVKNNKIEFEKK